VLARFSGQLTGRTGLLGAAKQSDSTMSSSSSSRRGGSTLDLVKGLARLRDTDPSRFPSAYDELKVRSYELWEASLEDI